jgi:hypothetical protein
MPSDLNLKKSWNPQLLKNREKVWEKEREIFDQYKKSQEHSAKIHQINEKNELLALAKDPNESNDKNDKNVKTGWMYQSTSVETDGSGNKVDTDILLGKRRLDSVIRDKKGHEKVSRMDRVLGTGIDKADRADMVKGTRQEKTTHEVEKISKSDPLYAIKLQQQKRQEQLEKHKKPLEAKRGVSKRDDRHREHRHHRHRHRHQDGDSSRHESRRTNHSEHRHHNTDRSSQTSRDRDPERKPIGSSYRNRD